MNTPISPIGDPAGELSFDTALVRFDAAPGDPLRPTSTPIYQTATFAQESALECGPYDYSRSGNPTRAVLESQLARLEGATRAFAFSSGLAALTAVCRLVPAGGHIVAGDDLYGGTYRMLSRLLARQGITFDAVDTTDPEAVAAAIRPETELLLVETPTNPLQQIADIGALADVARAHGVRLAVDNTLLSPYAMQPLALGADIVVHSATKALCGHGDVTAGAVCVADEALVEPLYLVQNGEGAGLAPFDSWLLLRGLKTLAVRLDRQQDSASRIARHLAAHPAVDAVFHPGLPDHPGHALHRRQARGDGVLVSFTTGSVEASCRLVEALQCFTISVSLGSVSSLASLPCRFSHASIPAEVRATHGLPEDLVRLSIGLESLADLTGDLDRALDLAFADAPPRSVPRSLARC